jgi:undecaprenyl-diphosphatase
VDVIWNVMNLNLAAFEAIQSLTGISFIDELMLYLAELLVVIVPLTLMYLWFQGKKGKEDSILTFTSAIAGLLVSYGMGLLYSHQNPSVTFDTIVAAKPENAFPSQHTAVIFSAVWPLFWREKDYLGILVLISAVGTALARVYIGEHWPIDIIGSIAASGIGFGLIYVSEDHLIDVLEPLIDLAERIEKRIFGDIEFLG